MVQAYDIDMELMSLISLTRIAHKKDIPDFSRG